jgi:hypothetical protein
MTISPFFAFALLASFILAACSSSSSSVTLGLPDTKDASTKDAVADGQTTTDTGSPPVAESGAADAGSTPDTSTAPQHNPCTDPSGCLSPEVCCITSDNFNEGACFSADDCAASGGASLCTMTVGPCAKGVKCVNPSCAPSDIFICPTEGFCADAGE